MFDGTHPSWLREVINVKVCHHRIWGLMFHMSCYVKFIGFWDILGFCCRLSHLYSTVRWSSKFHLTQWGRVTQICINKLAIIGPDNGLSPGWRQAIIWTNVGILLIRNLGTNFSGILSKINTFSFKKMHLKMSSVKWWQLCFGLNVLTQWGRDKIISILKMLF